MRDEDDDILIPPMVTQHNTAPPPGVGYYMLGPDGELVDVRKDGMSFVDRFGLPEGLIDRLSSEHPDDAVEVEAKKEP